MAEPSLLAPVAQDPFADLSFPEFQAPPVDETFAFEDFDLDDLDLDLFDIDLFAPDGQHSPPPPPLATSSSSPASPEGGSSSGAGGDGGLRNEDSSESSSRSATGKDSRCKGKGDGAEEDEAKRRARLVRNRESAHLSRQRKKHYVEELEGKVKAMQVTIADLSARISCVTAENAALKQQLGGAAGGTPPSLPMYPAVYPLPMPWVHPAYAMRGSQVPLVPIPRLKPQQPVTAASEPPTKKARKTKKVASVSLLGLLCLAMVCGCLIPAINQMYGAVDAGEGVSFGPSYHHGRVLAVEGPHNSVVEGTDPKPPKNASETLPALLYLPKNGKHVKINGNLVIKSIVASEEAYSRRSSYDGKSHGSQGKEETSLAIPGYVSPLKAGETVESTAEMKNKLMALAPGDRNMYREDDGLIPQWFSEAMSGPMLSSGMCTEVFQFDVSPSSDHANGIVPVHSNAMSNSSSSQNFTENLPAHRPHKNRRILYSEAIPLRGLTSNDTDHLKAHPKNESYARSKPVSSVVVSVLADPREAGDGNSDGRTSSKSLSRIFVVVLIDSVKYVTYSCVLPFKYHSPHL
jgi:hypothetical protein